MAEVLTASFGLQAAPAGGEQRDFTFRNRRRGEVAFDGCMADARHLAGTEASGRGVGDKLWHQITKR